MFIDGKPVTLRSISDAKRRGIAVIHQELMLAANLDIAGNIFLGNEAARRAWTDQSKVDVAPRGNCLGASDWIARPARQSRR